MGLGDATSWVITPIAGAFGHPCVDPETRTLIPGSPCGQRVESLNRFSDKMYDIFWESDDKQNGT
jgi:hypothetical protein